MRDEHHFYLTPSSSLDIRHLQQFYRGFYRFTAVDNEGRRDSSQRRYRVYVAPLVIGSPADLSPGRRIAYVDHDGGKVYAFPGLRRYLFYRYHGKAVFIFDNHQHAFFFWIASYLAGNITPGCRLVHIDRHSDMWQPAQPPDFTLNGSLPLQTVFEYTTRVLTNATFIKPALQLGLFDDVEILNGVYPPVLQEPQGYVLDIDMDIFEGDQPGSAAYRFKMRRFRSYMANASLVTIATSPGFIAQSRAVDAVRQLFQTNVTSRSRQRRKAG